MIIEIGTSDFRTQAGKVKGLFIEPVKEYFDRLPDCNKENLAVSNYSGQIDLFYIPSKVIEKNGLPSWLRGCNSVGKIHDTILKNGWESHCIKDVVEVVRIKSLIEKHNINKIDFLKIDTEGHDCIILNDFFDTVKILPKIIQFESNVLSDEKEVSKLIDRLTKIGYKCTKKQFDTVCKL